MAKHRSHSIEFKRQVAQEFLGGETLHGLAKRHDISRNLIRVWVEKYEAGAFDDDAQAADLVQAYEARIAALERLVGKQALELEFLRGMRSAPRQKTAITPQSSALPHVHRPGCELMGIARSTYYEAPSARASSFSRRRISAAPPTCHPKRGFWQFSSQCHLFAGHRASDAASKVEYPTPSPPASVVDHSMSAVTPPHV